MLVERVEPVELWTGEAIADPVNCAGISGKGLALAIAERWPSAGREIRLLGSLGKLQLGSVVSIAVSSSSDPTRWIVACPTKSRAWWQPSQLEWIEAVAGSLAAELDRLRVESADVPALGCGLGGLSWDGEVKPLLLSKLSPCRALVRLRPPL